MYRWVRNLGWRAREFLAQWLWQVLSLILAVVGLASIFTPREVRLDVVFGSLSGCALLLTVWEVHKQREAAASMSFSAQLPSSDLEREVLESYRHSAQCRVIDVGADRIVVFLDRSEELSNRPPKILGVTPYVLPPQLAPAAKPFLRELIRRNHRLTNDPMLGLNTWAAGDGVRLYKGGYGDYIATNHLAGWTTKIAGHERPEYGRNLFLDPDGKELTHINDSALFNGLGVSTMAVTTDGCLVVVRETQNVSGAERQARPLAPSGSGGVEPRDYRRFTTGTLSALLIEAAERELSEETAVERTEIDESYVLGYGRWIRKGACPEGYLISFLTLDSSTLRGRRVRRSEKAWVGEVTPVALRMSPSNSTLLLEQHSRVADALSPPLVACLELAKAAIDQRTVAGERLQRLLNERAARPKA